MTAPHERQIRGPAADFAATLAAENPRSAQVARRLQARHEGEFDGSQVWVHRPVARNGVSTRVETEGRRDEDRKKIVEKGL